MVLPAHLPGGMPIFPQVLEGVEGARFFAWPDAEDYVGVLNSAEKLL